jgi:lipoate-protein ligase A
MFESGQYRLIYDLPTYGSRNMAVDEAIMTAVAQGDSPPTLRLYAWNPACLSLGYGQRWSDADVDLLESHGWELVRRLTGGRAILHTDEVTYSFAVADGHPLAQESIVESYRRISKALLRALDKLGARTEADKRAGRIDSTGPVCFETPSHYEITTQNGRKLVGSAQVRRRGGLLQHGSLPLFGDMGRICDALFFETEKEREAAIMSVRTRAATLEDALGGVRVDWGMAAEAIAEGFAETFDVDLIGGELSHKESDHAEQLIQDVYANCEWTKKR